jgi:hypothetical protein
VDTKRCCRCGVTKPRSAFYHNQARGDGLQTYCKACDALRNRTAYQAARRQTPEYKEYQKAYAATHSAKISVRKSIQYYDNRLDHLYRMAVRRDAKKNRNNYRKPNPPFKLEITA